MIEASWTLFVIASIAIIATPGQDMILVMSRSIAQGAAAGVATAAGVSSGLLLHTVLATFGVGAIVQTSALLFVLMKLAGAAYLIYLGVSLLRVKSAAIVTEAGSGRSIPKLWWDGAFSNLANPKVAIFYFAFLPQFVTTNAVNPSLTIFALGAAFALITFLIKGPIGFCAGQLSQWLQHNPIYLQATYRLSGLVLIGLGIKLVFEKQH